MFLQSGNNNCDKDLIPYQNQKYYKVKNNADSDYHVDQLGVFIYFWKRHLGYIHKYTHHPCTNCVCENRLFGAPFEVAPGVHAHSHMNGRVPGHARTASTTYIEKAATIFIQISTQSEQMKVNLKHKHCVILVTSLSCQMNPAGLAYTQCV